MTNLFILSLLIVIAANLLLGAVVIFTHVRRSANRVFAILSLIIALWLGCQYFGSTAASEAWLAFWIRQSCAASVFIPVLFHLLRAAVAQPGEPVPRLLRRSWPWVAAAVATAVLCQTRFFLTGARLAAGRDVIAEPEYGPGFVCFVGFWLVSVAAAVWCFFRSMMRAEGVCRLELQVMSIGSLFGLVPGVLLVLVIPLATGSAQSAQFTPITVVIWHGIIAYGIATRHIMGAGEFLRRAITFVLLAGFLAGLYLLVLRLVGSLPAPSTDLQTTVAHVVAAIVVALVLAPARDLLRRRADRLFSDSHDTLSRLLHQGGDLARSIATVDTLFTDFGRLLQDALGLTRVRVYLRADARFVLHTRLDAADAGKDAEADGEIDGADPLPRALQAGRYPLLRDVLRRSRGTPLQVQAEHALARLGAEAAVALKSKNGLAGFLLLGRRQNGRFFGKREEDALTFLGDQLGIAIENATLYTRLQEARIYNEVLLDNLVTGVVATDREGRVTVCNREAQRILRLAGADAALGRPAGAALPAPMGEALRTTLASGRGVRDRDLVLRPQAADEQSLRFATAAFGGADSAASGALLVAQDTSAVRKLEEQIRRSDRLASIGTLAAGMAHEIKNPLVCLKTFVQLLPSHYDNPDFRETFVPLLGKEVERINAIVTQLLGFSRPVKPTLVPLALHATLDAAWQLVAQQLKTRRLAFARRYEADSDRLLGDQALLSQVFLNLFLNGMDAMQEGGALTVSTHTVGRPEQLPGPAAAAADAWVEVRVRDTGCGIAADDRRRVFDPFYTTKANGTGLGLSVAHGIITEHRGLIDVESEPEAGTCFRVWLPLLPPAGEADASRTKGAV